jgi:hypothetical protein
MKSILAGLTLTLWILSFPAYTQTDSVYCLPLGKARLLVADALKLSVSQSQNSVLLEQVRLLEERESVSYLSYNKLLNTQKEKDIYFREITAHLNDLVASYKSEVTLEKKLKKGWKAVSGILGILLILALL